MKQFAQLISKSINTSAFPLPPANKGIAFNPNQTARGNPTCMKTTVAPNRLQVFLQKLAAILIAPFHPKRQTESTNTGKKNSGAVLKSKASPDDACLCHAPPHPIEMYFVRNARTRQGYTVKIFSCPDCAKEYVIGRNFATGAP